MNIKALWSKVQDNKVVVGGLGVVAVAALAWFSRKPAGGTGGGETGEGEGYAPAYNVSAMPTNASGGYTAGPAYFDSAASDVYNALQPALEELGQQYEDVRDLLKDRETQPAPTPVPAPEAPAPRSALGLYQVKGKNELYQVFSDNTRRHVGLAEAKENGWWRNTGAVNWTGAAADWTKYRIVTE